MTDSFPSSGEEESADSHETREQWDDILGTDTIVR